jgi:hypothetical protein
MSSTVIAAAVSIDFSTTSQILGEVSLFGPTDRRSEEANYVLPIVVPPGRLGIEPHLSIAHDSSSGDPHQAPRPRDVVPHLNHRPDPLFGPSFYLRARDALSVCG